MTHVATTRRFCEMYGLNFLQTSRIFAVLLYLNWPLPFSRVLTLWYRTLFGYDDKCLKVLFRTDRKQLMNEKSSLVGWCHYFRMNPFNCNLFISSAAGFLFILSFDRCFRRRRRFIVSNSVLFVTYQTTYIKFYVPKSTWGGRDKVYIMASRG